jgi:hypothetical protein
MFSIDQKKFIVQTFGRNPSAAKVRREFIKRYKIAGRATSKLKLVQFTRVRDQFENHGSIQPKVSPRKKTKRTEEVKEVVRSHLEEISSTSLRKTSQDIDIKYTTLWRIARFDLHLKFYHYRSVQPLTPAHKAQRLQFCNWLLAQPADFPQTVIWTDEKTFCLKQKPHRKNDGIWAKQNPHLIIETNDRNDLKVMLFVAIVDGKIPVVHAFLDDTGRPQSVNGPCYLSMLQDSVWPKLRHRVTRSSWWWMQDGAPAHCTQPVLSFLNEKFGSRIISRRTDIPWPAHSPDLNVLDFHFWAMAQRRVFAVKPETVDALITCIKDFAENYSVEALRKACASVRKRARFCLDVEGGHFQHLL